MKKSKIIVAEGVPLVQTQMSVLPLSTPTDDDYIVKLSELDDGYKVKSDVDVLKREGHDANRTVAEYVEHIHEGSVAMSETDRNAVAQDLDELIRQAELAKKDLGDNE